jgi:tetratricopeptide (TPR) repeat protein
VPRISLCTIARDEERFLPACLASVKRVVDEIVVVDTGSRDRTVEVARAAGARVVEFPWRDDFAAARNAGLEQATGTHVLVLDADERLARGAGPALVRAANDLSILVGMLPLHDADALDALEADVLSGRRRRVPPTWLPRFFVRLPGLVFRRRVHETILHAVEGYLASSAVRIEGVDAPIVHYGEVESVRAAAGKRARNTRLLEMALADDPLDGEIAGCLAMELARGGELARAEAVAAAHFQGFLARIDALAPNALKPSPVQLAQALATCQIARGDAAAALETVEAGTRRCLEPHPNLLFLAGTAHERLGALEAAVRAYEACIALDGRRFSIPVNAQFTGGAPRLRLANLALARGHARDALVRLDGVGGTLDLAARLTRAEALLVLRDAPAALRELEPLLAAVNPPPDLFALAAWAATLSRAVDPVLQEAARRASGERWIEPRRRSLLRPA